MVGAVEFFFFFQAEDCIRDGTVTGVQTCALPISGTVHRFASLFKKRAGAPGQTPARDTPAHSTLFVKGLKKPQPFTLMVTGSASSNLSGVSALSLMSFLPVTSATVAPAPAPTGPPISAPVPPPARAPITAPPAAL